MVYNKIVSMVGPYKPTNLVVVTEIFFELNAQVTNRWNSRK